MQAEKRSQSYKDAILLKFMLIYFFVHVMLYSSHNFKEALAKEVFKDEGFNYSYIEMLSVIKLGGSVFCTWICQNRGYRPLLVGLGCVLLFTVCLHVFLQEIFKSWYFNMLIYVIYTLSDTAILPTIDIECLFLLDKYGMESEFSKIRLFSTVGHAITYIINQVLKKWIFSEDTLLKSVNLNTVISGLITALFMYYTMVTVEKIEVRKKDMSLKKYQKGFSMFSLNFLTIIVSSIGIGVSRTSFQSYLTMYLKQTRGKKNDDYLIYFVRTISELFVWSIVIRLKERVSLEVLFPFSLFLGSMRSFCYTFHPENPHVENILPYFAEILKSAYSALFVYVSTKLIYKYSKENQKALALGIFTGVYSGLAPFISGILSFFIFNQGMKQNLSTLEMLFHVVGWIGLVSTAIGAYPYFSSARRDRARRQTSASENASKEEIAI